MQQRALTFRCFPTQERLTHCTRGSQILRRCQQDHERWERTRERGLELERAHEEALPSLSAWPMRTMTLSPPHQRRVTAVPGSRPSTVSALPSVCTATPEADCSHGCLSPSWKPGFGVPFEQTLEYEPHPLLLAQLEERSK